MITKINVKGKEYELGGNNVKEYNLDYEIDRENDTLAFYFHEGDSLAIDFYKGLKLELHIDNIVYKEIKLVAFIMQNKYYNFVLIIDNNVIDPLDTELVSGFSLYYIDNFTDFSFIFTGIKLANILDLDDPNKVNQVRARLYYNEANETTPYFYSEV